MKRKKTSLLRLYILACVGLLAGFMAVSACKGPEKEKSNTEITQEYVQILEDPRYGQMRILFYPTSENEYFEAEIVEADDILESFMGEKLKKVDIQMMSVQEMYKYPQEPRGMQIGGVAYININYASISKSDLIKTMVHEKLHFQGKSSIKVKGLSEEENITLAEFIVYNLTDKICNEYNPEKYEAPDYNAPKLDGLNDSKEELFDWYLGKSNLTEELEGKIQNAFGK